MSLCVRKWCVCTLNNTWFSHFCFLRPVLLKMFTFKKSTNVNRVRISADVLITVLVVVQPMSETSLSHSWWDHPGRDRLEQLHIWAPYPPANMPTNPLWLESHSGTTPKNTNMDESSPESVEIKEIHTKRGYNFYIFIEITEWFNYCSSSTIITCNI